MHPRMHQPAGSVRAALVKKLNMTNDGKMQVSDLRRALEHFPDDAIVSYERIEDLYFEKHGWETVEVPDEHPTDPPRHFIDAFTAIVPHNDKTRLLITAHY